MALTHGIVALNSSTAVNLFPSNPTISNSVTGENNPTWTSVSLFIQNIDGASAVVYIGGAGVTSSSYGISVAAGATASLDSLAPNTPLYAISSGSSNVAVLTITR